LAEFEISFAKLVGAKFAIGVGSGTDAIKISLRALGVKPGDEVITAANTFVATVGAIAEIGAVPVFVDVNEMFCLDTSKIEAAITSRTKAIVPVHFTGYMTKMDEVMELAEKYQLKVVEDSCQSILASYNNIKAGTWGHTGAFSLHPLKNINVWSDGGIIVTSDEELYSQIKLLRNHGLSDRDNVEVLGYNSRLDTFQAVVGNWLLPKAYEISEKRIKNATQLDRGLSKLPQIKIPERPANMRVVYHLYSIFAENRDDLMKYCLGNGISAKVHYPIPIYRQKALAKFTKGNKFPVADWLSQNSITFPCDQHLEESQLFEIISVVSDFYGN
jgi:dTDP-4-amino-4,6-dideoxygalactose transaminase